MSSVGAVLCSMYINNSHSDHACCLTGVGASLGKIGAELRKSIDRIAAKERVINKQVSPSTCISNISHACILILTFTIVYLVMF